MSQTREVQVYLDFGGNTATLVGLLRPSFSGGRSLASSSFEYDSSYLTHPRAYAISPELPLTPGRTYTPEQMTLFGAFADASPDLWGKKLIEANHALRLKGQPGLPRRLGDFDFLLSVSDHTRMGALRLRNPQSSQWLASDTPAANIHELKRVLEVARRYEDRQASDEDVAYLSDVATSPGGARPKANIVTENGKLAIMKLPHSKDGNIDVEAWEAVALNIAKNIGIRVPVFTHDRVGPEKSVLGSIRFDRDQDGGRYGYMSASTAMQLGAFSDSRATYQDFADTISSVSSNGTADLHEMFNRIALTVLINNVDDHWRNHGFLHSGRGWRLSPVFDINPSTAHSFNSRAISDRDDPRSRDIRNLIDIAQSFNLAPAQAREAVLRVAEHVQGWPAIAKGLGISGQQQKEMAGAFDQNQLAIARDYAPPANPSVIDLANPEKQSPGAIWVAPHSRNGAEVAGYWRKPRGSRRA